MSCSFSTALIPSRLFARDSLRRRFQSTHDDVCFTVMALIPTLASQVLEDMDVEALTNELQSVSRASRSRTLQPSLNKPRSPSTSGMSSVSDVHSDPGSGSFFDGDRASTTSGSWIEHMSTSEGPIPRPDIPARLSDSITSASSSLSHNTENSATSAGSRTKGQLWNEVKILGAAVFVGYVLPSTKPFSSTDTHADHVVYDHSALAPHRGPTQCPWS